MAAQLLLAVTERSRRRLGLLARVDLGHVEIVLWEPPRAPDSYGFFVAPATPWRVFLSIFRAQRARLTRSRGFPRGRAHWRAWELGAEGAAAAAAYLDEVGRG